MSVLMGFLLIHSEALAIAPIIHIPDTIDNKYMSIKEKVISISKCLLWPYYVGIVIYVGLKETAYKYTKEHILYWFGNFVQINLEK